MADEQSFFGRWSRRKQEVREGRPLQEPPRAEPEPSPASAAAAQPAVVPPAEPPPPPTLDDAQALTPQSDFRRFVAPDVEPEVKNAAMKKLFADPHFNVMDGLDTYIDDYSQPDPLPASMLRQLASAQFLQLFDNEKREAPAATAVAPAPETSAPALPAAEAEPPTLPAQDHEHTDLRLQQDHAAGPPGSGRGPE